MVINRTKNTIRNSFWGMINKIVTLTGPFVIRTCIIYVLGSKYVGLSSLFTSIISILSLAELGFGSAIVYSMYQPIVEGDDDKICALMNVYKKIYRIMGAIVLGIGLILLPFIPYFINDTIPNNINIYILYGIYLLNSVSSYWLFAYKNCLLTAFQRNDISNNVSTIINLIMYILQVLIIYFLRNYYLYLICIPVFNILINIITAYYVDRKYPRFYCQGEISKQEMLRLKQQVVGLLSQRLAFSSRNAFDSIIISSFLGLTIVSIYNNYFYILNAITSILSLLYASMQGGIGNSIAKDSIDKNYEDMRKINFMYMWIAGWCSICILVLMQPFMNIWVGSELLFSNVIVVMFAFYFFTMKMTDTVGAYIAATGIWWKCKSTYLLEAIVNLVLNILLGYLWGVYGVIIATIISVVFVNYVSNVIILYREYFKYKAVRELLLDDIYYLVATVLGACVTYFIASQLPNVEERKMMFLMLAFKVIICCIVPNLIYFLVYRKHAQFIISMNWIKKNAQKIA